MTAQKSTFSRSWTPAVGDLVIPCHAVSHVPLDPNKTVLAMRLASTNRILHTIPGPVVALGGTTFLHPEHGVMRLASYEIVSWKVIATPAAKEDNCGAA